MNGVDFFWGERMKSTCVLSIEPPREVGMSDGRSEIPSATTSSSIGVWYPAHDDMLVVRAKGATIELLSFSFSVQEKYTNRKEVNTTNTENTHNIIIIKVLRNISFILIDSLPRFHGHFIIRHTQNTTYLRNAFLVLSESVEFSSDSP